VAGVIGAGRTLALAWGRYAEMAGPFIGMSDTVQ
jgi:hypothetical protein